MIPVTNNNNINNNNNNKEKFIKRKNNSRKNPHQGAGKEQLQKNLDQTRFIQIRV